MEAIDRTLYNELLKLDPATLEKMYLELEGYERKPVDVETFVTDPYYLGNYFEGKFRKFWLKVLKDIFPSPYQSSPYWLITLRGSIGTGKTTTACVGVAYDVYKLLCLKSPQKALGVIGNTKIVFAILNMTLGLASDVVWDKLSRMFSASPFFFEQMSSLPSRGRDSLFPKGIDFSIGSRIGHTLGKDIVGAIVDEANFEVIKGQVEETFNSLLRRIQSRYMQDGKIPGKIWIVSSESDKASTLNKLSDRYRNKQGVYTVQASLWEVVPERYSGKTFKVFVGSETRPPEIITEQNKNLLSLEPDRIIDVPIEHKEDFEVDLVSSLRDLAGYSTSSTYKLFKLKHKLNEAITVTNIFPDEIQLDFDDDQDQIQNYLLVSDYFMNPLQKDVPRCIHIDIGLSGDRLGIAASFVSGYKEKSVRDPYTFQETVEIVPTIITEWCLGIKAKGDQQIPLYKVRLFLNWLVSLGYNIDIITCDGFQSADMIQWAKKAGFNSEVFSVDRTSLPYLQFRTAIYEGSQVIPSNDILKMELQELELSADGKKVDHPPVFSNGEKGSKDIADAVCGSSCVARDRSDNYKVLFLHQPEVSLSSELQELFWGM